MRISGRAIIIKDNEVYLMFRRRLINNKLTEYYAIPGGKQEENETIEECVIREIKEEFNLDVKVISYLGEHGDEKNWGYYYYCEIIGGQLKLGGEEAIENCSTNYYEIRKVNIKDLEKINIYPENKKLIIKALNIKK